MPHPISLSISLLRWLQRAPWVPVAVGLMLMLSSAQADARKKRKKKKVSGEKVCATFAEAVVVEVAGSGWTKKPSRYAPLCTWTRELKDADARNQVYGKKMMAHMQKKMAAKREGREAPKMPRPPHLADRVSINWRGDAADAAQARAQFDSARRTITKGITVSAKGSPTKGYKTSAKIGDRDVDPDALQDAEREANRAAKELAGTKDGKVDARLKKQLDKERSTTLTVQADVADVSGVGDGAFWNAKHRTLTVVKGKRMISITVELDDGNATGKNRDTAIQLAKSWL